MQLTQHQQDMLDGKYGKGTAYAMKIQVADRRVLWGRKDGSHYESTCGFVESGGRPVVCGKNAGRRRKMPCDPKQ